MTPVLDWIENGGGLPSLPPRIVYVAPGVNCGVNTRSPLVAVSGIRAVTLDDPVKKFENTRTEKLFVPVPTPLMPMNIGEVSPGARVTTIVLTNDVVSSLKRLRNGPGLVELST
jgi:hypothetical protein